MGKKTLCQHRRLTVDVLIVQTARLRQSRIHQQCAQPYIMFHTPHFGKAKLRMFLSIRCPGCVDYICKEKLASLDYAFVCVRAGTSSKCIYIYKTLNSLTFCRVADQISQIEKNGNPPKDAKIATLPLRSQRTPSSHTQDEARLPCPLGPPPPRGTP